MLSPEFMKTLDDIASCDENDLRGILKSSKLTKKEFCEYVIKESSPKEQEELIQELLKNKVVYKKVGAKLLDFETYLLNEKENIMGRIYDILMR